MNTLLILILIGFIVAILAVSIHKTFKAAAPYVLALYPLGLTVFFFSQLSAVHDHGLHFSTSWVPSLGINFDFALDGLSLLMALLVSGIGTFVVIYAGGYLHGDSNLGKFYLYLMLFMSAMLGVVLADNIILLFIFWELTSISSFFLIGYKHKYEDSRDSALQALLITGAGGLALLAGLILLAQIAGTTQLSALIDQADIIQSHALYPVMLMLVLAGAFTKSAQFPFHFWLPGAMAAPTPVSAYLHSATMVKAGIYLLARLHPALSGTPLWIGVVTTVGAFTMLMGGYLSWQKFDLKKILAYSTISALGTLTMLLGIGSELAVKTALTFLLGHSLYKGALFMLAGGIDHETGTRDVRILGGLRKSMPITFVATVLAILSMSGIPPLFGFVAKELIYETTLDMYSNAWLTTAVAVLANIGMGAAGWIIIIKVFFGPEGDTPKHAHETPWTLWAGPVTLAALSLIFGIFPNLFGTTLLPDAYHVFFPESTKKIYLALWHGFKPPLYLSIVTVLGAIGLYLVHERLLPLAERIDRISAVGPQMLYKRGIKALPVRAGELSHIIQNGKLRNYLLWTTLSAFIFFGLGIWYSDVPLNIFHAGNFTPRYYEIGLSIMLMIAAIGAAASSSRMVSIAFLGIVGYVIAVFYILFGAPDLAMTQFSIETLSVILLVLAIYKLPRFAGVSTRLEHRRDAIVAGALGALVTLMIMAATAFPLESRLTPFFSENTYLLAKGENVVNVILVDFRGMDTMGEVVVLVIAALGAYALTKLVPQKEAEE